MKQVGWLVVVENGRVFIETNEYKLDFWYKKGFDCVPFYVKDEDEELVGLNCEKAVYSYDDQNMWIVYKRHILSQRLTWDIIGEYRFKIFAIFCLVRNCDSKSVLQIKYEDR